MSGWEGVGEGGSSNGHTSTQSIVDLTEFDTVEELMQPDLVSADQIKKVQQKGGGKRWSGWGGWVGGSV